MFMKIRTSDFHVNLCVLYLRYSLISCINFSFLYSLRHFCLSFASAWVSASASILSRSSLSKINFELFFSLPTFYWRSLNSSSIDHLIFYLVFLICKCGGLLPYGIYFQFCSDFWFLKIISFETVLIFVSFFFEHFFLILQEKLGLVFYLIGLLLIFSSRRYKINPLSQQSRYLFLYNAKSFKDNWN